MCYVQSLEKDFYLGTLGSFDHDFTLLDICSYKDYNKPLSFNSSNEPNQFVDTYALKKNKFLEDHGKMLAPSCFTFSPRNFLFL